MEWRQCREFPGYWVSAGGEVASSKGGKFVRLSVRTHFDGRRSVTLRRFDGPARKVPRRGLPVRTGRQHWVWVADLVLSAFVRPRRPGEQALHLRGGVGDDRVSNLAWGSVRERNLIALVRAIGRRSGVGPVTAPVPARGPGPG